MSAPVHVLSESNTAGQTVTDNTTTISYASIDASSTSTESASNPVQPGSNSYEKYNRLKLTGVATNNVTNYSFYFNPSAVQDSGGNTSTITMKYAAAVNQAYAQPATTNLVATTACSTNVAAPGQNINGTGNVLNAYTAYIVTQLTSTVFALGGNCTFPSPWLTTQFVWS